MNNTSSVRCAHFHAHPNDDYKQAQIQSWVSSKSLIMVTTRVIRCGYNYSFVRIFIHHGSFKSFIDLHKKFSQLVYNGKLGVSKVVFSVHSWA